MTDVRDTAGRTDIADLQICTLSPARRNPEQANCIQLIQDSEGRSGRDHVLIEYACYCCNFKTKTPKEIKDITYLR